MSLKINPPAMRKFILTPFSILFLFVLSITSCSKEEQMMTETQIKSFNSSISSSDLVGHWQISRMESDTLIDLNDDDLWSRNLLEETSCFNTMSITFNADSTFITNNATMTFESGANGDQFSCIQDREDSGTWKVENDDLILTLEIEGATYTHRKTLMMSNDTFAFEVTKIESDQYVDDPGNTQASPIRILELEYVKQN